MQEGDLLSLHGTLALAALIPVPGVAVAMVPATLADEVVVVGHASRRTFALLALPLPELFPLSSDPFWRSPFPLPYGP